MSDNMVSAIQSIIERINGQRTYINRQSQPTATNDQQGVHLFIDADSSGKHIFPGFFRHLLMRCIVNLVM